MYIYIVFRYKNTSLDQISFAHDWWFVFALSDLYQYYRFKNCNGYGKGKTEIPELYWIL